MRSKMIAGLTPLLWWGLCATLFAQPGESPDARVSELTIGGAKVELALDPELKQTPDDVLKWVHLAGDAVTTYYGRFPVSRLRISVAPRGGEPVNSGTTYSGRHIVIHLDPNARLIDLTSDWMMTHEMFHLGFPTLDDDYHYLEEGLSDYLEPLARARIGNLSEAEVWKGFVEGMPKGLPRRGEGGLDGTSDWGRTYWGGCIFWMLVDLDIRERSQNRMSLDDSIRAIVAAGGTGNHDWTLDRVIEVGDRATGTGSIRRIHDELGPRAFDPQLDEIWKELGVRRDGRVISFDETAPQAALRRSMTVKRDVDPSAEEK